jgi:hypothetical protein
VLVDEALPDDELAAIRERSRSSAGSEVVGYHQLRTRRAGARRYVDLHVQFRAGTTLESAHGIAHQLQDAIAARLRGADVLIHLEPEDKVREDRPSGMPWLLPPRLARVGRPPVERFRRPGAGVFESLRTGWLLPLPGPADVVPVRPAGASRVRAELQRRL